MGDNEEVVRDELREKVGSCRMYENEFPEVEDLVMVLVKDLNDVGAFVDLLEYDNLEGIILLSELSRRRIRSVNKHIRVGRREILQVLRVDESKGYIDLSKKNLNSADIEEATERYRKSNTVHSILRHLSEAQPLDADPFLSAQEVYEQIGWPLYRKYGHAYDALKKHAAGEDVLDGIPISDQMRKVFDSTVRHRMGLQKVKVQADVNISCVKRAGVDGIRSAILGALEAAEKEFPPPEGDGVDAADGQREEDNKVFVKLDSSPLYSAYVTTTNEDRGHEMLRFTIDAIARNIRAVGGACSIKTEPRVVTATNY